MRRRDKNIIGGALILGGISAFIDVILQWVEYNEKGIDFTWDNYNGLRTIKNATAGSIFGAGAGYAFYRYKISEETKLPFNSDEYIRKLLTKEHLKSNPIFFKHILSYRNKVKQFLRNKFDNKLAALPEDAGSFFKRTAINSNYDLDIILPFKKNSYNSLEEMYHDVYEIIGKTFGSKASVTKQTKAIGITFENNGNPIHFDIVPGREINNYALEKDLNLYVKPNWVWQRGSLFKTNIGTQKKITTNKPKARAVIKLLKIYRDRNSLSLPSITIEQCVTDALSYNKYGVHYSATENLLNSMDYIIQKMEEKSLFDICNTNNNLHDKLSVEDRKYISSLMQRDIRKIGENSRFIREIFGD
jgi:hypothetical protein